MNLYLFKTGDVRHSVTWPHPRRAARLITRMDARYHGWRAMGGCQRSRCALSLPHVVKHECARLCICLTV